MVFFKVSLLLVSLNGVWCQGSYYSSFSGPVSGAVDEIAVPEGAGFQNNENAEPSFDYVAKPDYTFGYGVNDPETGNAQKHEETRDGDTVRGQYSVLEPDGSIRTVVYTADPQNGFQATVHRKPPAGGLPPAGFENPIPQDFGTDISPSLASDFTPSQPEYSAEYDHQPDYTPADYQPEYNPEY